MNYLIVVDGFQYRILEDLGTLEQLQELVGGYIEVCYGHRILALARNYKAIFSGLPYKIVGWIDEEGKMKDYKVTFALGSNRQPYDLLLGPVVLCLDLGEETKGFSNEQLSAVCEILDGAGYCYTGAKKTEEIK